MPQSYLVFDFGSDEELAQQARRALEGWKQGFRLDKKLLLKFERESTSSAKKGEAAAGAVSEKTAGHTEHITLIVRLDFSEHERLSHERWRTRIPSEAPFKDAHPKVVTQTDPNFTEIDERFEGGPGRPHGFTAPA
jgi:hypothetical protein